MIKFGVDALETGFHLCLCLFSLCFFVLTVGNTALQSCGSFSLYHYRWKLGQKHMTLTVPKNIPWTLYPLSCWLLSICRYYLFYISSAVHIWCSPNTSFPSPRNVIVPFVLHKVVLENRFNLIHHFLLWTDSKWETEILVDLDTMSF